MFSAKADARNDATRLLNGMWSGWAAHLSKKCVQTLFNNVFFVVFKVAFAHLEI